MAYNNVRESQSLSNEDSVLIWNSHYILTVIACTEETC